MQRQSGGRNIAPEFLFNWFVQLARATEYMHDRRVVHRDIKASNIFFYGPKLLKLGDFGLACSLDNKEDMDPGEFCGTPQYMCPDRLHERQYDERTDLWALGCLFYELSALRRAYDMPNNARTPRAALLALKKRVSSPEGPPPLPKVYPKEWRDLIKGLLSKVADDRPTLHEVFRMPFLKHAMGEVNEAFEEECSVRPLPEPFDIGEFELRALEETAAAQKKAATLLRDTLEACRAERTHVREERAAEKKAEEKAKGMRGKGVAVKPPQLSSGRKSVAASAAASVAQGVAARVAAAAEARAATDAAAVGTRERKAGKREEAVEDSRPISQSSRSSMSSREAISSCGSARSSTSSTGTKAGSRVAAGAWASERRGSARLGGDSGPEMATSRPESGVYALGESRSMSPRISHGYTSSPAPTPAVAQMRHLDPPPSVSVSASAMYEVKVSSPGRSAPARKVSVPRVAGLSVAAHGPRRNKFLADVKPKTDTGRGTVPPNGPLRPSRKTTLSGAGSSSPSSGKGGSRSPGKGGSGSPGKGGAISPKHGNVPDVTAHLASAKARRAASLLQDANGRVESPLG